MLALGAFLAGETTTSNEAQEARKRTIANDCSPMQRLTRSASRKALMLIANIKPTMRCSVSGSNASKDSIGVSDLTPMLLSRFPSARLAQ